MKAILYFLLISLTVPVLAQNRVYTDPYSHLVHFIEVEKNVKLEVLEWEREGKTIVFVSGMGNSGHVFDDFAYHFTPYYRVLAISRRGYGNSSKPDSGYDSKTRATDIKIILDSLSVEKVILIGHSLGGDELSTFSKLFPSRVEKLIYLDAFNYGDQKLVKILNEIAWINNLFSITLNDSSSIYNLSACFARELGFRLPLSELFAISKFDSLGRYIGDITPNTITQQIIECKDMANFERIEIPALLFFAMDDSDIYYYQYKTRMNDSTKIKFENSKFEFKNWKNDQINQFKKTMLNCKIVILQNASHYIFITNEAEVVKEIFDFLNN